MKLPVIKAWTALLAVALASVSCMRDKESAGSGTEQQPVVITLDASATRAGTGEYVPGGPADSEIGSLRVLVYEPSSGRLRWDYEIDLDAADAPPHRIEVRTGLYDFVFIANANSDGSPGGLAEKLADPENYNTLAKLSTLTIDRTAFNVGKDIPMVAYYEGVRVEDERTLQYTDPYDGTSQSVAGNVWPVDMERAGICVSMSVWLTDEQYAAWNTGQHAGQIGIGNIPGSAFVLPHRDNSASQPAPAASEWFTATDTMNWETGTEDEDEGGDGSPPAGYRAVFCRVLLPELVFVPGTTQSKALVLTVDIDGEKKGMIFASAGEDFGYTMPRNTWLHLRKVTVDDGSLSIQTRVLEWNEALTDDYPIDGDHNLWLEKSTVVLSYATDAQDVFEIGTDYPTGWTLEDLGALQALGITVTETDEDHLVTVSAAGATADRQGTFTVRAGNLLKTVTVRQKAITNNMPTAEVNSYVGAFWKATQTGERLIRVERPANGSLDGQWTALVMEGKEWIVLDTEMTSDSNVGWRTDVSPDESLVQNGGDAGFDAAHAVTGTLTSVGGTLNAANPAIYFRIGLKGAIPAGDHRYGMVLLICDTDSGQQYTNRIWIRQGEDADYLMRDSDPDIGTGGRIRTGTAEFSPYNLTAATMMETTEYIPLDPYGGAPVAYPTQAGAMLQFTSPNPRYAYHPTEFVSLTPMGWDAATNTAWSFDYETCPPGYRRPDSGSTRATSEMAMSLMADLSSNRDNETPNSVWGYYADGFFDRRKTGKQTSETVGANTPATSTSAVAMNTKDVAYVGRLFYNSGSGSSLFFPASGMLEYSDGTLHNAGSYGHYWSRTESGTDNARTISINRTTPIPNPSAEPRSKGYSVRCVVDENPPVPTPLDIDCELMVFDHVGQEWLRGDYAVTVTTDAANWTAVPNPGDEWAVVTIDDSSMFHIEPLPYTDAGNTEVRTGTIIVKAGNAARTVTVRQYPPIRYTVDRSLVEFDGSGRIMGSPSYVTVQHNADYWEASPWDDWVTLNGENELFNQTGTRLDIAVTGATDAMRETTVYILGDYHRDGAIIPDDNRGYAITVRQYPD